jgi:hypothetical protein
MGAHGLEGKIVDDALGLVQRAVDAERRSVVTTSADRRRSSWPRRSSLLSLKASKARMKSPKAESRSSWLADLVSGAELSSMCGPLLG